MKKIENEIVQKYVVSNKQERIKWELSNSKKREAISKHFHKPTIFKTECLYPINYMDKTEMQTYLYNLSKKSNVYFIGEDYIGDLSLKEAVERASEGEICIIYCGEGIGYYQGEQEKGAPPRFMLVKK